MEIYDIVKKLIGPIDPVGETNSDDIRYENLKTTIKLVNSLLFDIDSVACCATRQEHSMARAGKYAKQFITEVKEL